jgi:acetyl-CoA synthetase
MRRILRKVAANEFEDLGDVSTLAEPAVVEGIVTGHKKLVDSK